MNLQLLLPDYNKELNVLGEQYTNMQYTCRENGLRSWATILNLTDKSCIFADSHSEKQNETKNETEQFPKLRFLKVWTKNKDHCFQPYRPTWLLESRS